MLATSLVIIVNLPLSFHHHIMHACMDTCVAQWTAYIMNSSFHNEFNPTEVRGGEQGDTYLYLPCIVYTI